MRVSLLCALRSRYAAFGIAVGLLALVNHPVFAQQGSQTSESTEEITVTAPHLVQRQVVGRSMIGAPIEVISLSRKVSYADLDLTTPEGWAELRKRVSDTAKAACKQLDMMYPDSDLFQATPSDQNCVKTATKDAMDLTEQIIAASTPKK